MFTTTVKYAIKACLHLASVYSEQRLIGKQELCEHTKTPISYTSKVMNLLVKAHIVDSVRGPHGGFMLKKHPRDLSVKEIVIAIEGKGLFTTCFITSNKCNSKEPCELHCSFFPIMNQLSNSLESISMKYGE